MTASAEVDLRRTLMVSQEVPVGFQRMSLNVHLSAGPATEEVIRKLIPAAERCGVIYQTLKPGMPVHVITQIRITEETAPL